MSKGDTWENELLEHLLNNAEVANVGDATGLRGSSVPGSLYVSLHVGDPGEAGDQTTNEISYTSYARQGIVRTGAAWTVTGSSASPASEISFPESTGGAGGTVDYFAIGTVVSGSGKLLYSGTVTPNIVVANGVTPKLKTTSTITED